ncbi:MAG TPA: hypothetical protein VGF16_07710 [Bryobacteraceae bacterium]
MFLRAIAGAFFLLGGGLSTLSAQILTVPDGTPVRLQLNETVSSAEAHEGQTVPFEVSDPVVIQGLIVIPKGSVALGKVTKSEPKRRFGRSGALEISVDSVRLIDGSRAPLRADAEKGTGPLGGGRLAATIAVSPVLVWVKGKDVSFQKGTETTAYVSGDARLDEAQLRRQVAAPAAARATPAAPTPTAAAAENSADRSAVRSGPITNDDIIQMQKAGISEDIILTKIGSSATDFRTGPQDLIELKQAGLSDGVITAIVQKSTQTRR